MMLKLTKPFTLAFLLMTLLALSGCRSGKNYTESGYIEGRYTYVSSQMAGRLDEISVIRGTTVKKNQPLFKLEPDPQHAEYEQAQAKLANAKATLADLEKEMSRPSELEAIRDQQKQTLAQIDYVSKTVDRYQKLVKQNFIQQESLDKAVSNYNELNAKLAELGENLTTGQLSARIDQIEAAKATVAAAEAEVQKTKWQLSQKTIFAPVAGRVYDTYYRVGEDVPVNHPVLSMLAPENVYVVFYVPEVNLAKIKIGHKIEVTCDSCTKPIPSTIYFVSSKAEYTPPVIYSEKSRSNLIYRIEGLLSIADAQKLHPGQPITVNYGLDNGK